MFFDMNLSSHLGIATIQYPDWPYANQEQNVPVQTQVVTGTAGITTYAQGTASTNILSQRGQ